MALDLLSPRYARLHQCRLCLHQSPAIEHLVSVTQSVRHLVATIEQDEQVGRRYRCDGRGVSVYADVVVAFHGANTSTAAPIPTTARVSASDLRQNTITSQNASNSATPSFH